MPLGLPAPHLASLGGVGGGWCIFRFTIRKHFDVSHIATIFRAPGRTLSPAASAPVPRFANYVEAAPDGGWMAVAGQMLRCATLWHKLGSRPTRNSQVRLLLCLLTASAGAPGPQPPTPCLGPDGQWVGANGANFNPPTHADGREAADARLAEGGAAEPSLPVRGQARAAEEL